MNNESSGSNETGSRPARVLLVDDHLVIRAGLRAMLDGHPDVVIVGEAGSEAEALSALAREGADVVLLDYNLGHDDGVEVCAQILDRFPQVKVVFLTAYDQEQLLFRALRAGAHGYLLKGATPEDLLRAIRDVLAGEVAIDARLAGRVAQHSARLGAGRQWAGAEIGLTERESEVLLAVVDGLSNREVAGRLFISEGTVKTHLRSVFSKLGVSDRAQAVSAALRRGLAR